MISGARSEEESVPLHFEQHSPGQLLMDSRDPALAATSRPAAGLPRLAIVLVALSKTVCYGNLRALYPLQAYLCSSWGISLEDMSWVLFVSEFAALPSVVFGPLSDLWGPRTFVVPSLLVMAISTACLLAPPMLASILVARAAFGCGLAVWNVTAQNALMDMCPPHCREAVVGILETSWAVSVLTLVPLFSMVLSAVSWQAAFGALTLLQFICVSVVFAALRGLPRASQPLASVVAQAGLRCAFVFHSGAAMYNASGFLFALAHNTVLSEFSILLKTQYHLGEADAGYTGLVIGAAELLGAVLCTWLGHVPHMLQLSSFAFVLGLVLYGLGSLSLATLLVALFGVYVPGELHIILRIAKASCFAAPPDATSMLAMHIQFLFVGRALGPVVAVHMVGQGHFATTALAIGVAVLALVGVHIAQRQNQRWRVASSCASST
jgi:predicted MFS family arabinose efflux permease